MEDIKIREYLISLLTSNLAVNYDLKIELAVLSKTVKRALTVLQ